jgi:K+-sensing histidine kinase KdpD
VAFAAVAAAVALRLLLDPVLHDRIPFLTFEAAVVFTAWYAGRGPALAALVGGAAAVSFFFLIPRASLAVAQRYGWPTAAAAPWTSPRRSART